MEIVTNCPSCGARFKFTEKYFGRSVKCPKCSGAIAVPQPERSDEGQRCPSCGVPLAADAPLCPQCGYDLAMANLVDSAPATPKKGARAGAARIAKRNRGRQSKLFGLVTVGAVGGVLLAAGGFWVYWTNSQGTSAKTPETSPSVLVLDWPAEERFTGAVKVDDRKLVLPESGDVQYTVPSGKHRVVLTREGYEPLELDLSLGGGQRHHYKPQWTLAKPTADEPSQEPDAGAPGAPAGSPAPAGADAAKALANFDDWLQDFEAAKKKAAAESKEDWWRRQSSGNMTAISRSRRARCI